MEKFYFCFLLCSFLTEGNHGFTRISTDLAGFGVYRPYPYSKQASVKGPALSAGFPIDWDSISEAG